jgi:hypothetical protein
MARVVFHGHEEEKEAAGVAVGRGINRQLKQIKIIKCSRIAVTAVPIKSEQSMTKTVARCNRHTMP